MFLGSIPFLYFDYYKALNYICNCKIGIKVLGNRVKSKKLLHNFDNIV
jgi:hypothetical protein